MSQMQRLSVASPLGGLFYDLGIDTSQARRLGLYSAHGKLRALARPARLEGEYRSLGALGQARDPESARVIAVAEGIERYALTHPPRGGYKRASASELGDRALDLDKIPRASAQELAEPACPVRLPGKDTPVRWVSAWDVFRATDSLVPMVMAYNVTPGPGENFWAPISTGCAAHTDLSQALVRAIEEVIERDAVSSLWLQNLRPPEFQGPLTPLTARIIEYWAMHDVSTMLFDATTDFGVPTIFCIQLGLGEQITGQIASAGTGISLSAAAEKALLEVIAQRTYLAAQEGLPEQLSEFSAVWHGARYMMDPSRRHAFDFLTTDVPPSRRTQPTPDRLPEIYDDCPGGDAVSRLRLLLERIRQLKFDLFLVDLTGREAAEAGFFVVRALIPAAQPLSLRPLIQYRAHPRLYELPVKLGIKPLPGEETNPWPVPFA